jgi:hypothetical protein
MKKYFCISMILVLISAASSAQRINRAGVRPRGFNTERITRPERFQLRRDMIRLNMVQRNARRDGIVTPIERRRIHRSKCNTRRDVIRFRHNGRNRII